MSTAGQQVNLVKVNRGRGKNGARCSRDRPYSPPERGGGGCRISPHRQSSMPVVGAFFPGSSAGHGLGGGIIAILGIASFVGHALFNLGVFGENFQAVDEWSSLFCTSGVSDLA